MSPFLKLIGQRIDELFDDHRIINWNPIKKCIFIFVFFIFVKILWILWKGVVFFTPEFHQYINLPAMIFQFKVELIEIFVALLLIVISFFCLNLKKIYVFATYFSVNIFGITQLYDAYMSGIFSAGTVLISACYLFVGMILFNSRAMLSVIVSMTIVLGIIGHLTLTDQLAYAPLFNSENIGEPQYKNAFWLGTTGYFCFPVFFISLYILKVIIHQWKERENYIAHLGDLDPLTGLYNRRMLNQQLVYLDQNKSQTLHAIFMLDLDHFKQINDHYGHIVGDQVLEKVAETLKMNVRNSDILGRYGGEEFLILLKNINAEKVKEVAERCCVALSEVDHEITSDIKIKVSCSIGISFIEEGMDSTSALNAADEALYKAKAQGRNQICYAQSRYLFQ